MGKKKKSRDVKTKHLWGYAKQRVRKDDKELTPYYCISINPQYYNNFLGKQLIETQNGSSLVFTISGCLPYNGEVDEFK